MTATSAAALVARLGQTVTEWGGGERPTVSGGVARLPRACGDPGGARRPGHRGPARCPQRRARPRRVTHRPDGRGPRRRAGSHSPRHASHGSVTARLRVGRAPGRRARARPRSRSSVCGWPPCSTTPTARRRRGRNSQTASPPAHSTRRPRAGSRAVTASPAEAPQESRIIAVAAAFVTAGGGRGRSDAGRALGALWAGAGERYDPACVRALERLVADQA